MVRLIRSLIAVPLFLLSAYTFVTAIWNFGTAAIFQHLADVVVAFAYLGATAFLIVLVSLISPKAVKTMPTIKTVTIPADPAQPVTRGTMDAGLAALQAAVGGYIQPVGSGADWTAWADEDGKAKGRPFNVRATHAMAFMAGHNMDDPIVGDVVVTGHTADGEPADLAGWIADRVVHLAQEVAR